MVPLVSDALDKSSRVVRNFGVLPNDFKRNYEIADPNDDVSGFLFAVRIVSNSRAVKDKSPKASLGAKFREETFRNESPIVITAIHAIRNQNRRDSSRRPSWF